MLDGTLTDHLHLFEVSIWKKKSLRKHLELEAALKKMWSVIGRTFCTSHSEQTNQYFFCQQSWLASAQNFVWCEGRQ